MDAREWAVLVVMERALKLFLKNGTLEGGTTVLTSGGLTYRLSVNMEEDCTLAIFNAGAARGALERQLLKVRWRAAGPRRVEVYEPGSWEEALPSA